MLKLRMTGHFLKLCLREGVREVARLTKTHTPIKTRRDLRDARDTVLVGFCIGIVVFPLVATIVLSVTN